MIVCDRDHLGLIDASAARNAFGRQLQSFEADLEIEGIGDEPLRAVFIRAPWVERAATASRCSPLMRGTRWRSAKAACSLAPSTPS